MAVIRQKYNPAVIPAWVPVNTTPAARPSGLRALLSRITRILDGDPERILLSHQVQKRIDKTRADIYLDTGAHWF